MSATVTVEDGLRTCVEALCAIERPSTSPGEREAAHWLAGALRDEGLEPVIEEERAHPEFARSMAAMSAIGAIAALVGSAGRLRGPAVLAGLTASVAIAEDAGNGPQLFRRLTSPKQTCWNVTARVGEADAPVTVLVLAHHDAPGTGAIFDQSLQQWLAREFPDFIERTDQSIPLWWPVVGGPALGALGVATGRRGLARFGALAALVSCAAFADIHRSALSPGANDNASGVAGLVALAAALRAQPVDGVQVLLVSCGAEEVLQGGIRPWMARHAGELHAASTFVVNLESVASPRLVLLEGEGTVRMEEYCGVGFRDRLCAVAEREGIALRRGLKASASTDSVITSRAGLPTATLCSIDAAKALSNYHRVTDTPENADYATIANAVALTEAVIRDLAP